MPLARKKKRPFSRRKIRDLGLAHEHGEFDPFGNARRATLEFYRKNIHITRSIDEIIVSLSPRFAALSQERRYELIHTGLGVQGIIEFLESDAWQKR